MPSVTIAAEALRLSCPAYKGAIIGGDKADSVKAKAPSPCHNAEALQADALQADAIGPRYPAKTCTEAAPAIAFETKQRLAGRRINRRLKRNLNPLHKLFIL